MMHSPWTSEISMSFDDLHCATNSSSNPGVLMYAIRGLYATAFSPRGFLASSAAAAAAAD